MRVPLSSLPTTLAIDPGLDPLSPIFTVCFLTVTTCTPVYSHSLWAVDFKQDLAVFFQSIPWPTSKHFALWSFRLVLALHRDTIKLISYENFIILIIQNDLVSLLQVHVQGCNNIYCKCLEYKHSLPQNSSLYTNLLDTQTPKSGQLNHPMYTHSLRWPNMFLLTQRPEGLYFQAWFQSRGPSTGGRRKFTVTLAWIPERFSAETAHWSTVGVDVCGCDWWCVKVWVCHCWVVWVWMCIYFIPLTL